MIMRDWAKTFIAFASVFAGVLIVWHGVFAQDDGPDFPYKPLAPLPGTLEAGAVPDFATYLQGMFRLGIGIAVVLAVGYVILGGVQYMLSSATDSKGAGKAMINRALLGLGLALTAWLFLNTINPALVNFNLNISVDKIVLSDPPDPEDRFLQSCYAIKKLIIPATQTIPATGFCENRR